jgi:hypothetical protein
MTKLLILISDICIGDDETSDFDIRHEIIPLANNSSEIVVLKSENRNREIFSGLSI